MARKTHNITGIDYDTLAKCVKNPDIQIRETDDGYQVRTDNRREEAALAAVNVAPADNTAEGPARETGGYTRRYVELESVANHHGLNRGKSWICGEIDIQTKGAHPSWEGDAICYVYE